MTCKNVEFEYIRNRQGNDLQYHDSLLSAMTWLLRVNLIVPQGLHLKNPRNGDTSETQRPGNTPHDLTCAELGEDRTDERLSFSACAFSFDTHFCVLLDISKTEN